MGKHLSTMDEMTLQECVRLVEEEFSMVLGLSGDEITSYILARI